MIEATDERRSPPRELTWISSLAALGSVAVGIVVVRVTVSVNHHVEPSGRVRDLNPYLAVAIAALAYTLAGLVFGLAHRRGIGRHGVVVALGVFGWGWLVAQSQYQEEDPNSLRELSLGIAVSASIAGLWMAGAAVGRRIRGHT